MNPRILEFVTGIEASAQPDAGTPTDPNDVLTLTYFQTYAAGRIKVFGSPGAPTSIVAANGLDISSHLTNEDRLVAYVQGSGGAVNISKTPAQIIHGLAIGGQVELRGCDDTNTVQIDNDNGVVLNSDSIILKSGSVIGFRYNGTNLEEQYRNGVEA